MGEMLFIFCIILMTRVTHIAAQHVVPDISIPLLELTLFHFLILLALGSYNMNTEISNTFFKMK